MSKRWSANAAKEQGRLAPKENDWCLPGSDGLTLTRTRHGGICPQLQRTDSSDSSDSSYKTEDSESDEDDDLSELIKKPNSTQLILESDSLKDLMERNLTCPKCSSRVEVSFPTITIASGVAVKCKNKVCAYIDQLVPASATLPQFDDNRERNTDYALNILYVLSAISNGDGGSEAEHTLGFLGLQNDTTIAVPWFDPS
jgi:hypothetical protein